MCSLPASLLARRTSRRAPRCRGGWRVIPDRAWLDNRAAEFEAKFGSDVPCPPFWGGYTILPSEIEFWQGRENRLHDRFRYARSGAAWAIERLSP
jgi:pyridoxamine 5'-phosphate oxidase